MRQLDLLGGVRPPLPPRWICLRLGTTEEGIRGAGAYLVSLVHADLTSTSAPPGVFLQHLGLAHEVTQPDGFLVVSFALEEAEAWFSATTLSRAELLLGGECLPAWRWRFVSLLDDTSEGLAHAIYARSGEAEHMPSVEQAADRISMLRQLVDELVPPGHMVLDVYPGRAPMARACLLAGSPYRGTEPRANMLTEALSLLAQIH